VSSITFTVGDLRQQLQGLSDSTKLSFDGGLTFGRLKRWGDDEFVLLFEQPQGALSESFKKRNPGVKVVFVKTDDVKWDESGIVSDPIDVSVR
jgi:hypothetical protein